MNDFPSLLIRPEGFQPQGAFAEAQAAFLQPDSKDVDRLSASLERLNAGVVAHYYMDPELQGVLSACDWPHIAISDSLKMADAAVAMADAGVGTIYVLGVDFMSENVRAMLDASNHQDVVVYRVDERAIGCSLAESAEAPAYAAYLRQASQQPRSLHVVYVNTSLRTKAHAHAMVPTITCTSSNVVKTVLSAAAQIPDVHVWFGPDTYMGRNLESLFEQMANMDDAAVQAVHPDHTAASLADLRGRFHVFRQGMCVVHHMFGADVAQKVRNDHQDAFVSAHLEVPGEMFALALELQAEDRGVVGSTANILSFIKTKLDGAIASGTKGRLKFVLGTEAGMITSIVRAVQERLRSHPDAGVDVEIIFPVASEAVTQVDDPELALVPGVAGGEGCAVEGGCATCPYMKMNSLDALLDLMDKVQDRAALAVYEPEKYTEMLGGESLAAVGTVSILHMRHFQQNEALSNELVADVLSREPAA
ncbi:MAG: quinolinate synthase NadA [Deltaproteobacteria bacterium]|nr:quinolinate synthase NadA [Deltaproteobacteria bacterium]